jgi:hypothetical protein
LPSGHRFAQQEMTQLRRCWKKTREDAEISVRATAGEEFVMTQLYLQRFEYRAATKSEFDQAWAVALQTFARTGNWGGTEAGVRHVKTYGTAWGGYVLLEADDAEAFGRYQLHHAMNYGHMADITFEALFDLDAALAQRVGEMRRT